MTEDEIIRAFFIEVEMPGQDYRTSVMNTLTDATSLAITQRWSRWETKLESSPPEDWRVKVTVRLKRIAE